MQQTQNHAMLILVVSEMAVLVIIATLLSLGIAIALLFIQAAVLFTFDIRLRDPYYRGLRLSTRPTWRNALWLLEVSVIGGFCVLVIVVANKPLLSL